MIPKRHTMEIAVISALFIVLSVWGIIWDITSGLVTSGIDGIMLLFVCLMMAGIFAAMMLFEMQKAGMIPAFGGAKAKSAAPAAKPAPAAAAPPTKAPGAQATMQTK
jgi:bacteriorhodopsin